MTERVHAPRPPRHEVTAVLDQPDRVLALVDALRSAGFPDNAIRLSCGQDTLTQIDPHGAQRSLLDRLRHGLEHFGLDGEERDAAVDELRAGHVLVAVRVVGEQDKQRAAAILREQRAHRLRYWSDWTIETLSP
jgi:hypothetical protein